MKTDLITETKSVAMTESSHTAPPIVTGGPVDSHLGLPEPSGETRDLSSERSSTIISEDVILKEISVSASKERHLPSWLEEWERPEAEAVMDRDTVPLSALGSGATQSPDTVSDPEAHYQSDSSGLFFLVSAEYMCRNVSLSA